MLSLKDFKEVTLKNDFSINGGVGPDCTDDEVELVWIEIVTNCDGQACPVTTMRRNHYIDWTSDDTNGRRYGEHEVIGNWY
jgi:hypothetical protein